MINKKNEQNKSNENFNINQENIKYLKKKILIDNNNIQSSDFQNNKNIKQSNIIKININNSKRHNQKKKK